MHYILKLLMKHTCVGPTLSKDSYLNIPNILSIATSTGCDGVHPGYGFWLKMVILLNCVKHAN